MPRLREKCPVCEHPMITIEARIEGNPEIPMNRWSRRKVGCMCVQPGCNVIKREYFVSSPLL